MPYKVFGGYFADTQSMKTNFTRTSEIIIDFRILYENISAGNYKCDIRKKYDF